MALHSDLHNVIASLAKFVSGSSNELRTNLSKSPIQFICNGTYVTYLNITYLHCLYVEPIGPAVNYLLRCYALQFTLLINFAHAMFLEVIPREHNRLLKCMLLTLHRISGLVSPQLSKTVKSMHIKLTNINIMFYEAFSRKMMCIRGKQISIISRCYVRYKLKNAFPYVNFFFNVWNVCKL